MQVVKPPGDIELRDSRLFISSNTLEWEKEMRKTREEWKSIEVGDKSPRVFAITSARLGEGRFSAWLSTEISKSNL